MEPEGQHGRYLTVGGGDVGASRDAPVRRRRFGLGTLGGHGLNRQAVAVALLVAFVGLGVMAGGVVWLLGWHFGWAVIVAGALTTVYGLTAIDVDKPTGG